MVPVSVRGGDGDAEFGNQIAFIFVDIPCDEPDPLRRLETVAAEMGTRKETGHPEGARALLQLLEFTPRTVQKFMSRLASSERTFDLTVSNIPGPREPLWMLGCELQEAYPVVPMADSHSVSIGLTTVRDEVFLGVYADRQALPDSDALAHHIDRSFTELPERVGEPVLVYALALLVFASAAAADPPRLDWSVTSDPFRLTYKIGSRTLTAQQPGEAGPGGRLSYELEDGSRHTLTRLVRRTRHRNGTTYRVATDQPGRQATVAVTRNRRGLRVKVAS